MRVVWLCRPLEVKPRRCWPWGSGHSATVQETLPASALREEGSRWGLVGVILGPVACRGSSVVKASDGLKMVCIAVPMMTWPSVGVRSGAAERTSKRLTGANGVRRGERGGGA